MVVLAALFVVAVLIWRPRQGASQPSGSGQAVTPMLIDVGPGLSERVRDRSIVGYVVCYASQSGAEPVPLILEGSIAAALSRVEAEGGARGIHFVELFVAQPSPELRARMLADLQPLEFVRVE